jgi:hypothetical protein
MNRKIYLGVNGEHMPSLQPSKLFVPDWYKKIETFSAKKIQFEDGASSPNKTVKNCMPVLDSFTSGYMAVLWQDIYCEYVDGTFKFRWSGEPAVIGSKDDIDGFAVPEGYHENRYTWFTPYRFKLPKGYSALVTHPINRFDLPFHTISGVIDENMPSGHIPFFLRKGFTGIIEQGTPIYQVLPFKTENWQSEDAKDNLSELEKFSKLNSSRKFFGWYKNNVWSKKTYE